MASTTNILDLNNRIDALEKAVSGGDSAQANKKDIATEFNTTTNYTAGGFVYYKGKLYQFNADHAAGAWDPTDVVEANVTDQIVSNKAAIDGLTASDVAYGDTTVDDALDDLQPEAGTFNLTEGLFTNNLVNYKKQGNIVTIFINRKAADNISAGTVIGVVPDELKPSFPVAMKSAQGNYGLYLYENGDLSILDGLNTTNWLYVTLTYIL